MPCAVGVLVGHDLPGADERVGEAWRPLWLSTRRSRHRQCREKNVRNLRCRTPEPALTVACHACAQLLDEPGVRAKNGHTGSPMRPSCATNRGSELRRL